MLERYIITAVILPNPEQLHPTTNTPLGFIGHTIDLGIQRRFDPIEQTPSNYPADYLKPGEQIYDDISHGKIINPIKQEVMATPDRGVEKGFIIIADRDDSTVRDIIGYLPW